MSREGCELAFRAAVRSMMRNGSIKSEKLLQIIEQEKHNLEALLPSRLLCKYSLGLGCVEKFVEIAHIERLGLSASFKADSWKEEVVWQTGILKHDDWFVDQSGHTATIATFSLDSFMKVEPQKYSELFFRLGVYYFMQCRSPGECCSFYSDLLQWMPLKLEGKLGWKLSSVGRAGTIKFSDTVALASILSHVPRDVELKLTKFQVLWLVRLLGLATFCKSIKNEAVFVTACKSY